jgi:hypothetical protein
VAVGDHGGVDEGRHAGRLTSEEVAAVLRRAAELDADAEAAGGGREPGGRSDGGAGGGTGGTWHDDRYDTDAVEAAAGEVGLSPAAVRQAVAELRVGALATTEAVPARRRRAAAVSPVVVEQRLLSRAPSSALAGIEAQMRRQLFEVRRRGATDALYRPRADLVAKVVRKLDFAGNIRLDGVGSVVVQVTPTDGRTLVRVEATMAVTRSNVVAGSAGLGAAVALGAGFSGALLAEPAFVVAALPAGAAVTASGVRIRGRRWQAQRDNIAETLAGLLDRI